MTMTTIRVRRATLAKLRALAVRERRSVAAIVAAIVEDYDQERFWEDVNAEFAALRADIIAWRDEIDERAAWDATLGDGLL